MSTAHLLLPADAEAFRLRFLRHVRESELLREGDPVVVACSGGLDSTALLHLLRFTPELDLAITVAHFDHRMRPESAADARWLRGVARAWEVAVEIGEARDVPAGEARARALRYDFLREVQGGGAHRLLTAHHADDQAETVLFRVLRGTGPYGLSGIPERGRSGLIRPLLPFRRHELEDYARRARVPFRTDPSNLDPRFARNVLRHEILPRLERSVAAGAVGALARLARLARQEEEAWRSVLPGLLEPLVREETDRRIVLDRMRFLALPPALAARLLRELLRRLGVTQNEAGTRAALEFTSSGVSGRAIHLPGGVLLAREFDRIVLARRPAPETPAETAGPAPEDVLLEIGHPGEGSGCLVLGGRVHRIEWSLAGRVRGAWVEAFPEGSLAFPLRWRGWRSGDRVRLRHGSKKLSRLFAEARIGAGERGRWPVLEDGSGRLIWAPGVARSRDVALPGPEENLTIGVTEIDAA